MSDAVRRDLQDVRNAKPFKQCDFEMDQFHFNGNSMGARGADHSKLQRSSSVDPQQISARTEPTVSFHIGKRSTETAKTAEYIPRRFEHSEPEQFIVEVLPHTIDILQILGIIPESFARAFDPAGPLGRGARGDPPHLRFFRKSIRAFVPKIHSSRTTPHQHSSLGASDRIL